MLRTRRNRSMYNRPEFVWLDNYVISLHVKNDLDPYGCMFENCDSPEHLNNHSNEWINHMREHSLRWRCIMKSHDDFVCATRDEYPRHMKTAHPGKLTDAQLGVLASRNGRPVENMFMSCPLCGVEDVDGGIPNHLVGHLRLLALKSLPIYEEGTEEYDESDSEQNSLATS